MNDDTITCSAHGEAIATYVCGHLVANPAQQWFCDIPTEDVPWPDAWCIHCNTEYLKDGEWNEQNEDCLDLNILCNHCYDHAIAASIDHLDGDALNTWIDLITGCHEALQEKQALLEANFSLSKHSRWDYDQAQGSLIFSNEGVPAIIAEIEFIGSISTKSNTWLWAWANFHNLPKVKSRITAVRRFGEENAVPRLTVPIWHADAIDGWEVSGIAAEILGALGVYRVPDKNGFLFMAITAIKHAP